MVVFPRSLLLRVSRSWLVLLSFFSRSCPVIDSSFSRLSLVLNSIVSRSCTQEGGRPKLRIGLAGVKNYPKVRS